MTGGRRVSTPRSAAGGHATLLALTGGNVAQVGARLLLGAVVPLVLLDFETTTASIGIALTGMWAIYALLQFPSGVLADRYGERPLVILALSGTVVGSLLTALAPSLPLFGLFVLLLGAGTGLYFAPATSLVSHVYEEHGGPLSALTAGSAVAGVVFPAVGGFVGDQFGWRIAITLGAVGALPVLLVTGRALPERPPANPDRALDAAVDRARIGELLGRPGIAFVTSIAVVTAFTFQAITSFFPVFLVEYRGLGTGVAGATFGAVFGLSSVSQLVAGRASDVVARDAIIGASVLLTAAGFVVLLLVPGHGGLLAGAALLGVGISWPGPLQARVIDHLADDERGLGYGLVRTIYMLLAASGSAVVGVLADTSGWVAGFGLVAALLCVCCLALALNRFVGFDP